MNVTATALASRITTSSRIHANGAMPSVTFFVDGMAISKVTLRALGGIYEPSTFAVTDNQRGYTFEIRGEIYAERVALQIAKAYLFDVVAMFGTERLPEVSSAI